ncbi:hypothetical protein R3P38DRAFT_3236185 [Favolaschia claudopus]|uniref:Uncharacterized protein n=1 Tax=Favolaschia claudopus TaxID=2862362 RepID=A0AAV9ZCP3_9AGAR
MLSRSLLALLAAVTTVSAWQLQIFEASAGGTPLCRGGGTTISGGATDVNRCYNGPPTTENIVSYGLLNNDQNYKFYLYVKKSVLFVLAGTVKALWPRVLARPDIAMQALHRTSSVVVTVTAADLSPPHSYLLYLLVSFVTTPASALHHLVPTSTFISIPTPFYPCFLPSHPVSAMASASASTTTYSSITCATILLPAPLDAEEVARDIGGYFQSEERQN